MLLASCRKDEDIIDISQSNPDPSLTGQLLGTDNVSAGVRGLVVDPGSNPLADVTVTLGSTTTTTDTYGHFFFEDEAMNARGTLVSVSKPGYFKGSRLFFPKEGQQSVVKIQLLNKVFSPEFDAAEGGTYSLGSYEVSVDFPPSSIAYEDGSLYEGTVYIAAGYLNPTNIRVLDQMPGNLLGLDVEGQIQALQTYGMLALELESAIGEPLNLADGSKAQLSMPLPGELLNLAPEEIPLWSYNESSGLWQEESIAYLEDTHYVGEVSHFSLWNCDVPSEVVYFEVTLHDENNLPLANTLVTFTPSEFVAQTDSIFAGAVGAYTDENGQLSGFVPIGEPLVMEPMTPCATPLDALEIGPFNQDTDLGIVTVGGTLTNAVTLTGSLICGSNIIDEGVILVEFNGRSVYHYIDSPDFNFSFAICPFTTSIQVTGINLDNMNQGATITLSSPAGLQSVGAINTCGAPLENFISINIDGDQYIYLDAEYVDTGSSRYIRSIEDDYDIAIVGCTLGGIGDFTATAFVEGIENETFGWDFDTGEFEFDAFYVYSDSPIFSGFMSGTWNDQGTERAVTATFATDSN